jgi:hypothetical protein
LQPYAAPFYNSTVFTLLVKAPVERSKEAWLLTTSKLKCCGEYKRGNEANKRMASLVNAGVRDYAMLAACEKMDCSEAVFTLLH